MSTLPGQESYDQSLRLLPTLHASRSTPKIDETSYASIADAFCPTSHFGYTCVPHLPCHCVLVFFFSQPVLLSHTFDIVNSEIIISLFFMTPPSASTSSPYLIQTTLSNMCIPPTAPLPTFISACFPSPLSPPLYSNLFSLSDISVLSGHLSTLSR
jgi:hypothetical protein